MGGGLSGGPRTHVDRGGTFTDVVWIDGDEITATKVRSDRAVVGALTRGALTFGTTVATNALLERRGVRTLLLVSEGFGELLRLRHMSRPALFDPDADWPAPLAQRVVEVRGRIDAAGRELAPLTLPDLDLGDIEAVAIVLLHGPRNPAHELAVAAALARPDLHVVLGHQLGPEPGYLARVETALVDAAITPALRASMLGDRVPTGARAIRSDASLVDAARLRAPDAVLSGPAGGVLAVREVARLAGFDGAIGLDMGGTSTDVCFVRRELLRQPVDRAVAGVFLRRPMLAVDTIAAGGGSVLWREGGLPRVGPRSAGAAPGPQCYGAGGPPTLTDAALAAGLVDPTAFEPPLRPDAVVLPGEAADFLAVAREAMAAAVQRLAGSWGVDPAAWPLVAYGGAAGQHAADVAERLGIRTVLVHPLASVLSAWGQASAVAEEEAVEALWCPLASADVASVVDGLRRRLPDLPVEQVQLGLRLRGSDAVLPVAWPDDDPAGRFREAHQALFGFAADGELELVDVRVRRAERAPQVARVDQDPWGVGDKRLAGPRRLDGGGTSVWVPAGWTARRERGLLWLERAPGAAGHAPPSDAASLALWWSRLTSVAERAGEHLARLARSVSIRERRDFSCALFDHAGRLVVNAPHVPVHLGAMGETVRDLLRRVPDPPAGQSWLSNDPQAGGSHLPDLTVITCVQLDGQRLFVASRGHHADVGGITPGSMPPRATHIDEEGVVLRAEPLLHAGHLTPPPALLAASRQPSLITADLAAQIASNTLAARLLGELGDGPTLRRWMAALVEASERAVRELVPTLGLGGAEDEIDGVPLRVLLSAAGGRLRVDLRGTGGPHPGNLNAPRAVVRAAVLYVLRVLLGDEVPLNEGALAAVDLIIPPGSILDPPAGAAVAGGNVETSQRLVDLLLRALGARAASQGTMNNLTVGGEGWSLYETLGGGLGASAAADGASGRQVHMTNTRVTDPEVAELRLPVRVHRYALRHGSGGAGQRRGGDGLVRELEVLAPARASLLAAWRADGAPGLLGGGRGAPGRATVLRGAEEAPWDGATIELQPGDRVRVETPGGGGWGLP